MMEKQLFDWEDFDWVGDMAFHFEDCKLKVPIGDFKINDLVSSICVNYENGILTLYDEIGTELSKHELKLSIK